MAARLQALGLAGERVLLLFQPGLEYPAAFLGCLYAGAVAVPAYPPTGSRGVPRLQAILADCSPRCVLTTATLRPVVERLGVPSLCLEIDGIGDAEAADWRDPGLSAGTLAFLQYTSGSTSTPKGVMVSHGNLVANEKIIQEAIRSDETSVMVSWLPLYHDMGLIGGLLHPLWLGSSCVLMAPLHFLQRPLRWLRAVSRFGGVVSGAPNFAYELCARKISSEDLAGLDLSRWRVAFNGAEPVRAEALERFARAFEPAGFRSAAFLPCYGLAETTLMISGSRPHAEVTVFAADAEALARDRVEEKAEGDPALARNLVSCGGVPSGVDVRIVDPVTFTERPAQGVGEIWVAGATVTHGYWNRPEATAETFGARLASGEGPYLRTGDLGFLREGELFITGRIKDLILIRGRNLYPQDVEWTVSRSHPAARPDGGAAFTVEAGGEERLVVVQEVAFRGVDLAEVAATIRQAVAEEHEVQVSSLVLVKPGGVPKTTSGKIQRRECRQLFLAGGLAPLSEWREGEETERRDRVAPRTPAEERLARVWEEVLGLAAGTVGAEDNFFALGGDSVRGTQLLARLQEAAGVEVSLEELFGAPTLADLAMKLVAASSPRVETRGYEKGRPSGTKDGAGVVAPLTSPQRRLWFLDRLEPGNPAYNLAIAVRLSGSLDGDALARTLSEIVRRHEALRTVFRVLDDVPSQLVLPATDLPLPRVDVSENAEPVRAAAELERELAREPFELDHGPLVRARLVRLAPDEHELHLSVHHIVSDGWSFGVLLREIGILYEAFSRGRSSPLPELPVQYVDYAFWLERWLTADALEPRLEAWKRRLGGSLPVLELPADRPRPPVQSYRGAHATHVLSRSLADGLRRLAARHGASLFMALTATFQALLGRLTAQEDLIVGTAVANRDRVELEGLIGFFVNTVPLRADLSGDPSFGELLERTRGRVLEALAGREVPFERLVEELQIRRDLAVPPIVQVMLVLQNEPLEVPSVAGLSLRARETDNGTARFDLAVSLLDTEEGLAAVFKYSRDLFDASTIERLARCFEVLLSGAADGPARRLSELPLLGPAERQQIVVDWNATEEPAFQDAGCLHHLIERQVDRTPDAVAVTFEGESLTYRELDRRANRLAHHLLRMGVAPESLVGIAAERSTELMVGLLGILKAGGAYVPLDPSYPAERLAFMLEDAQVPVLLTQSHLQARLPSSQSQVFCLDTQEEGGLPTWTSEDGAQLSEPPGRVHEHRPQDVRVGRPRVEIPPDSPAYCIYTSGSTGLPKGALNTHRAIVNRLLWMQSEYGLQPEEAVLQKTPASFDVSVWELFWPLLVGARVVFARPGGHQDTAYLAGLIQRESITTLHFVPSMLQVFLEEPHLRDCESLRRVIVSGEALPRELEERFGGLLKAELHNLYGPTEAAVDVTAWPCLREPEARTVPIGRPIANLRIHLLDAAGHPAPVGVPGHLHIGGAGLARGYWRRPELTAERFVPDPFSGSSGSPAGSRLYATGDLARRRPDGVIEFLGRIDHQVKVRGLRIELEEIEAALNVHPTVRESVVLARTDGGGPRLVAYVAGAGGAAPDPEELRSFLAGRLPDYMVPPFFVVLPVFPLNPSGKVDRRALPAPDEPHRGEDTPWTAPRTPVEERLAAIWRELLDVEQIGVLDDFFALGGDSIQGALFINRLQRELDAILYVMALFDAPTVGQFAAYLEASYRDALVAAGWIADESRMEGTAGPVNAATEAAEIAALTQHLAIRFSPRGLRRGAAEPRNRPAVFLLSPFRSGSTLLRVMLAGHPGLFAPPELELLGFETLGERRRVFSGRDSFSREGLLRAVMELRACGAEAASALLEEAEARNEPTPAFYRQLQEWAGGRVLVDKTPRYALDLPTLRRTEDWFEAPFYIHLVRHPVATMQSYLEARMQEVYRFPLPSGRQAELVWRLGHENILEHLAGVPAARQHRLLFEEMVRDPRAAMEGLCAFLGIGFAPAMLSPYEGERMTDGLHGAGRMMGDPKFHQHRGIDAGVADRWRDAPEAAWIGEATWALAERLGYARSSAVATVGPRVLDREHLGEIDLPLSFGQQRLWFLDRLEPGSSAYHMPAAVRLAGRLDVHALARACAEVERRHEVLRTVFPAAEGRPHQVVREPRTALLSTIDLGALPDLSRRAVAARLAVEEALRPFELAAGPLWRVRLVRLATEEHALLVNLHHIVCDGWSVGLLTREIAALYTAFREGAPSPLPDLPLQYADFAAWQRRRLSGSVLDELLGYWKERLAGPLPVLELPLDRPRPQLQTWRGARLPLTLAPEVVAGLRDVGRGQRATLFMVLAAVLQTLLHRFTGQDEVLIGTPVASRNRAEIESLIGLFVNTLVLRSDLSGDPAFRTFLGRVRQVCLGAARHEEMPFEKLVEELGIERTLDRSPLFSVMLALQNTPPRKFELPGLTIERLDIDTRTAKLELTLDLTEQPDGGLAGSLEYNTDLFEASTAARLAGCLAQLSGGVAAAPGARLADLPLLTPAERQELVTGWNDTAVEVPAGATVHDLILETARRVPEAVAVSCEGESLCYGELAERAGRLARRLARLGVGPDVLVGICAERSPALLVALLGVLAAGGAYVPLDPANPAERLGHILADAVAPVLLTERALLDALPPHGARIVFLEEEGVGEEGATPRTALPDHLAYTIYTSGSTGRPKGVEVRHRSVVNYLACMARHPGLSAGDVMVAVTTLSFDIAVTELLLPLMAGARIELVRRETAGDAARLAAVIERSGATCMQATPSTWALLLDGGWRGRPGLVALCGGEALPRPLADRLLPCVRELWNVYGPTETTIWSALHRVGPGDGAVQLGRPMGNQTIHLLGRAGELVPPGAPGELCIGGAGLARGYRGRPDLTAERFVPDSVGPSGSRLYRTGDLARRLADGQIEYLGRFDHQVKIRGFRIETGEVEAALLAHPTVRQCVVVAAGEASDRRLVAYAVRDGDLAWDALRVFLSAKLPLYMVPSAVVFLERIPLLPSGKVDRRSLPDPGRERPDLAASYAPPRTGEERLVAGIWQEVLGLDRVGIDDNFFDLGGHSLLAAEVHGKLRERARADLPLIELFQFPTVRALADRLGRSEGREPRRDRLAGLRELALQESPGERNTSEDIAIVGMAGRFPGAADLDELWRNLREGVESVSFFSDAELLAAGVDPALVANPRYVRARAVLDGIELFDAPHFGLSPREAAITDPQQRLLLECAWEALESAGLDPETFGGRIGVYAGAVFSTYLLSNLLPGAAPDESWPMVLSNDKDTLATRIAYKLNLRGPSLSVQTACSTSVVAVHLARQALLARECDAALAGGVSVRSQQTSGYLFQEEGILSPDGHCRPFDAQARGTLFGSGVGMVVLKRLSDALADGDTIHAVLKSSAVNNDGSDKVGFMAPSVEGQAEVIARALALGGIDPETVTYVETHGSATPLGDPIEVAGLTRAFRVSGAERSGYCAIGSVKSNFGHLDAACGIAGLIKTVLALENREIPPSLNFERPNPQIDFASSPFFVNARLRPWEAEGPRRAGVSSFGIGGTNAHLVLEEAPSRPPSSASRPLNLVLLSTRTPGALSNARERLRRHLERNPDTNVADVAWTTQVGRRAFAWRQAVLAESAGDAAALLGGGDPDRVLNGFSEGDERPVAFLFPGVGEHYPGMAADLYRHETVFREELDRCAELLEPILGTDLREILYPQEAESGASAGRGMDLRRLLRRGGAEEEPGAAALTRTSIAQPAVFAVEYALARLWMSWGVRPRALLGYSVGEYVTACISGVLSLEDAVALVGLRARLIQELPPGRMLAVATPEESLRPLLGAGLWLAAANGPDECVVSGEPEAVADLERRLTALEIPTVRVAAAHAFHSAMLEPAAAELTAAVRNIRLGTPTIPYPSNLTGRWITAEEARDPRYWARHMCEAVRFSEGLDLLMEDPSMVLLEVGPGQALATLARRSPRKTDQHLVLTSLRHRDESRTDLLTTLTSLGRLWVAGVPVDWRSFHHGEQRRRVPLPTYPFERRRHWVEPPREARSLAAAVPPPGASLDSAEWLHLPSLRRSLPSGGPASSGAWLVVLDGDGPGGTLAEQLLQAGCDVMRIEPGAEVGGDVASLLARRRGEVGTLPAAAEGLGDDPMTLRIASIWREVLGVERIGPRDRFFDLGGDSLIALRVMARLRDAFAVDLSVRVLFEAPTVPGLRDAVEEALASNTLTAAVLPESAAGEPAIPRRSGEGPAPLTFLQQQLWFLDQLEPGNPAYTLASRIRLTGRLDLGLFSRALRESVARHEGLRTVFGVENGQPVQVILPWMEIGLPQVDLTGLPRERREAEAVRLGGEEAEWRFDLAAGPLVRMVVVQIGLDEADLLLATHHIVSDAWSTGQLLREMAAQYLAFSRGERPSLPPPPFQPADYAVWQRSHLEAMEDDLAWWQERLQSPPAALELPTDRPRPAVQGFRGSAVPAGLPPRTAESLNELARREEATPFMVLLTGFYTLLMRHSGQSDLAVATSVAGRHRREMEEVFGLFINTLVLRGDLSGEPSFRELLHRVRSTCLDAFSHQLAPFERILEVVRPERDLGRNPLFQVMFLLDPPLPEVDLEGLSFRPQEREIRASMFDLTLFLHQRDGEVGGFLQYSTDLFDRSTAQRLAARWSLLLEGAAASPGLPLAELPLLLPEERWQLLGENNDSARVLPLEEGFIELFRQQVARTPDAPAAGFCGETLTYAELDRRADHLARWLAQEADLQEEEVVAVLAERGFELLTAMLALFKAGLVYLPLDPRHPAHRHVQVLRESRARVVLSTGELAPVVSEAIEAIAALPGAPPRLLGFPDVQTPTPRRSLSFPAPAPQRLAYVIFTSGSTGIPKGAMVEHRGMLNHLFAKIEDLDLTAADVVAQTASQCFDISIWQFLAALLTGGLVEIFPNEVAQSPSLLLEETRRQGVTILETVPSLLRAMVEEVAPGSEADSEAGGSLRWMIPTGEALPLDLCNRWLELFPRIPLVNAYGPTECSDDVTHCVLRRPLPQDAVTVPIGRPVVNLRLYVVSRAFHLQPLGVPGELCVGGIAVGRGYLKDPLRTAAVFVPDPFSEEPGDRLYRTGDLARWLPEGDLEFLGRIDHQVKIRGFRIELGEIETALARHPAVRECVVVAREDAPGSRFLAAYVVARGEAPPGAELADLLRRTLPDYMVPSAFVALPALPLTPNGKVDRKALPAPERGREQDASFVPPGDPVEELLAGLWAEVLGGDLAGWIGVHDDFFELGGHSLLATQVRSRLRGLLGVDLPLRTLFEAPTLGRLAQEVRLAREQGRGAALPPVLPAERTGALPLSFAQQRLWLIDQLDPGSTAYNLPTAVRLTGEIQPGFLEGIFASLVRRHESLRTTFPAREGRPVQVVAAPDSAGCPVLPQVDLSAIPEARREELARGFVLEEARRPFDLQSGPLLRLHLVRLGGRDHLLLMTMHHIISDAWSWGVLLRDVAALAAGQPLPELPVHYADFAVWQREWLQGEALEAQLAHWKLQLAGAPLVLDLPTDRPRPAEPRHRGGVRPLHLPLSFLERVAELCRRRGVTPFMALLSSWAVLLGRHANQEEVLLGTPVAGRTQQEVENLIGFFINTLVIRADLRGAPGFGDLLARVREVSLDAFTHQSLPFERLVDEIAPDRDLSRPPVFQAMFVLQNAPLGTLDLAGLSLRQIPVDVGAAKFDLTLNLVEAAGGHSFLEYDADLFDAATAERLLARWETLLGAALGEPDRPLPELPLLPAAERWQTLGEWGDTAKAYPTGVCLHELVAAQAARTPDAVAAVFEGASLTYGDLVGRARRLAAHLTTLGVEPDARVGVFLERSLDMIVVLLGVLEAGAAYVPLDPGLPEERLRLLVESAGISIVLTSDTPILPPLSGAQRVQVGEESGFEQSHRPLRTGEDGLAYVIFTSGSTGTPKGVMIPHRGIVNRLLWMQETYGLTAADRVLQKTPFSFDVSLWEFFWPLLTGARLVFARPEGHKDPLYLAELIAAEGITTLHFVPSMLQAFLSAPGLEALTRVRRVMASGEALPPELVRSFFARMPHAELHNLYGPTEASVDVSFWACEPEPPRGVVPIGRPIANHRLHVVDRNLEPQPMGVHGELLLGGPGLARGYLGRPDLTAAAFVPDPFGNEPGGRLYRTGDLVSYLPNGDVSYLGRLDHQVKIRGFRIELGEIETVLAGHPAVRECVVTARQDGPGEKMLVAYLAVREEPAPEASQLQAWLGAKLPPYMIPGAFVVLPALPLSPNGKIDRKALPAPSRPAPVRAGGAPQTPSEVTLARIWGEILGVEQVGVEDNFFALGGDSILSIQVAFRAREAGLSLAPRDLFLRRNLGELAAAVAPVSSVAETAVAEDLGSDVPLTPVQHWFFGLGLEDPHHFNQALVLGVRERIDPSLLERALAVLVERHAALRVRFVRQEGGSWRQSPADTAVPLERMDLSRLSAPQRRSALEEEAAWLQASLRLETGPLLRVVLFDLGEEGQRLFLVLHHLIVDGVSWRILLADLETAYRSLAAGDDPMLLPAGTSLRRWGAHLATEARAGSTVEELGFWLAQVRDVRPLPVVRTGGENTVASARHLVAELDEEATRALLQEVPAVYQTQINDALLTALAQAFAGWTGTPRLLLDLEGHGREELFEGVDLSQTVGWLTAIYPVVLELDRRESDPGEALKSVKEQLRAIPRKGIGYGILRHLGDEATTAALRALPVPQVAFNYLGQLDRGLPEASLFTPATESGGEPRSLRQKRPWLLEIAGGVVAGRLRLTWTYSESCHDARTIQGVIDRFLAALRDLIEHCRTTGEGGFTPSDFPTARANQKDLDKLMARLGNRRGSGGSSGRSNLR